MHTIIIAEAGVNHNGSLEMAKQMALKAKECGAYYVYHTVCPTCGYYRGKVAIVKDEVAE